MPSEVSIASADQDLARRVRELEGELANARDQQAASAEVLQAISSSPTGVEPVFKAILQRAVSLCGAVFGVIYRFDGELIHIVAHHNFTEDAIAVHQSHFPSPPGQLTVTSRALLERAVVQVEDASDENLSTPRSVTIARQLDYRGIISVPMLREGVPIGTVTLAKRQRGFFTDKQVALLKTFADQAVIAIENMRLFEEVQARTREVTEALQYQTATSEVLQVISSSPGVLQPVYEAMLAKALRHCDAKFGGLFRYENGTFRGVAGIGIPEELMARWGQEASSLTSDADLQCLIACRQPMHTIDLRKNASYLAGDTIAVGTVERGGARSALLVPLVKDDALIGAFAIYRQEVLPFTEKQIQLVTTFADQAVIAIENTRLFNELRESLEYQTATGDILRVISSSPTDVRPVFDTISTNALRLCGASFSAVLLFDGEFIKLESPHNLSDPQAIEALRGAFPRRPDPGGATDRAILTGSVAHIPDVTDDPSYVHRSLAQTTGYRSILSVPMLRERQCVGAITVAAAAAGAFSERQVHLLQTFADQAVIAIENTRLFNEIVEKSRELEIASQHKSQFVANMSHELRTPLAAILGYAELMQEGFYGTPSEKSTAALTRIQSNGKHLLGLINTVLDIAKIESGQFSLNLGEYALETVVETVRAATESLAETKKLALTTDVAKSLPFGLGDEQRLTQVLLNLVGNAIKFTDTGVVRVSARLANSHFTVSVTDTGPGIPEEHRARIFEQFHQIDNSNTKAKGGTGLGLAIAKQIVEMHGGRIWVESTEGKGSTFQMQLPIRAEFRKVTP